MLEILFPPPNFYIFPFYATGLESLSRPKETNQLYWERQLKPFWSNFDLEVIIFAIVTLSFQCVLHSNDLEDISETPASVERLKPVDWWGHMCQTQLPFSLQQRRKKETPMDGTEYPCIVVAQTSEQIDS